MDNNSFGILFVFFFLERNIFVFYVIVVDEVFLFKENFMKFFLVKSLDDVLRVFNYRFLWVCRVSENVFGILVYRF